MVNVAEQPAVVDQEPGRHRVQVLLYLQVVIVPDPAFREVPAVGVGKTHHAPPEPPDRMAFHILLQRGGQRVNQVLRTLGLSALGEQAGQSDLKNAAPLLDVNALHQGGGREVFLLSDIGGGIEDMSQPAGNLLRPQGRIGGQRFVVVRVALDVGGIHGIQRVVQPVDIVQDGRYPPG